MNELILKLQSLGFSSYEAKAYYALLQKSPANGYEVSKVARIPPAKVYETLARLKNKGAVYDSNNEPVKYYPIAPDLLLGQLKSDLVETIDSLSVELQQVTPLPNVDLTWNLHGIRVILSKMISVIENASDNVLLSIWPQEIGVLQPYINMAAQRGITVITGVFGAIEVLPSGYVNLEPCGVTSQKRLGNRLSVAVGDNREVVIAEINDDENAVGVWATTPSIVLVAKEYIKHDIWGRYLVDALGEAQFQRLCAENDILSYLIKNR